MTDPQRVFPVEPLVATTAQGMPPESLTLFQVNMGNRAAWFYPEAELWAQFMPAEPLEALLAAVGVTVQSHMRNGIIVDDVQKCSGHAALVPCDCKLCAAYRAYVEAKP